MVDRVSSTYQPLGASLEFRYLTESEQDLSLVERQEQLHNEPPEISACHLSNKDSPAISQETPLPSFQNAYGVLRVDVTRPTGTPAHLWVVSVTRHGRVYNRNFNDAVYGNKESAWLMAVAYRDALLRLFPPYTRLERCTQVDSRNTSGVAGVFARYYKEHIKGWTAMLRSDGVEHRRYFSVKEYGEEKAKALAIAARQELLAHKHLNGFVTINASATQKAEATFERLLQQGMDTGDMNDMGDVGASAAVQDEMLPEAQRRLELLDGWFDAVRPRFMQLNKRVYSRHTKNHDILDISVGDGSPRGGMQRRSWTIQRRSYEELMPLAWDFARNTLTERFGSACWQEFERLYQSVVFASTREQSVCIRHRYEPPGHAALRCTPPANLQPMLAGFKIPALVS